MRIKATIDNGNVRGTSNIREHLRFEIFWSDNSSFYPTENWHDFGCIIIGWWITTLDSLLKKGEPSSFSFMDGPYSISVRLNDTSKKFILQPKETNLISGSTRFCVVR
jgi:hypothetical protein